MASQTTVTIIGAGVIGLTCAWRLAQAGHSVIVFEANTPGAGASLASLGVLWPPSCLRSSAFFHFHRESLNMFPEFATELTTCSGIDINFRRGPTLRCCVNNIMRENAQRECTLETDYQLAAAQPPLKLLSQAETKSLEPEIAVAPQGSLQSQLAAVLSIKSLITALTAACHKAGVQIHQGERAEIVTGRKQDHYIVRTISHQITEGMILAAAGSWSNELHPLLANHAKVAPVRGQALALKSTTPIIKNHLLVRTNKVYLIPESHDQLIIGSTTDHDSGFCDEPTAAGIATLLNHAIALAPALSNAKFVRAWAGLRPSSARSRPYLGRIPGTANLFVATGHYKTGVALAPLTAQIVVGLMSEDHYTPPAIVAI